MDEDDGFNIFGDLNGLHKKVTLTKEQTKSDKTRNVSPNTEHGEEYWDDLFGSSSNKAKKSANHTRNRDSKKDSSKKKSTANNENSSSTGTDKSLSLEESSLLAFPTIGIEESIGEEATETVARLTRSRASRKSTNTGGRDSMSGMLAEANFNENTVPPTASPPKRGRRTRQSKKNANNNNNLPVETVTSVQLNLLQVLDSMTNINPAARRQFAAEFAARAPQVDFVDLSSCVQPRVEGFISLDSDDEESEKPPSNNTTNQETVLNSSFNADNPEMSIKIRWNGVIEKYCLRKYQKFSHIFNTISEREHVPVEEIVLNLKNRFIKANDTPDSIDYKVFDFIDGRAMKLANLDCTAVKGSSKIATNEHKSKLERFQLKVQSEQMKRPIVIDLKKTDSFKILFIKCSEELNLPHSQLRLSFDGELISPEDTPELLELEGGEIIDLRIKP